MPIRVSVITCHVPGREEMIYEAYQSLLNQTEQNWEWLIEADDADSIDYLKKDQRVFIRNNNPLINVPTKRNRALLKARGEYIACLDDDDTLPTNSLQSRADALDENKEAALSFGVVTNSAEKDSLRPIDYGLVDQEVIYNNWLEVKSRGGSGVFPAPAGVMWRKGVLWEMGGWLALPRSEDTALLMRASIKYKAYFVKDQTYHIREHKGRMTRDPKWKNEAWQWVEETTEAFKKSLGEE